MSLREWIGKSGIVLRGAKYSTKGHEYLNDIIDDDHPWQIYMKGAQVAMSTTMLIKTLYVAEHLGKKAVYYFQNDGQVSDFSNDRCQTMLDETPYLASRVRSTNNVGLKQIGPGALYLRGLFTLSQVKSIDCDMVITDETDECKDTLIDYAVDRMMHSDLQWFASLSQPSFPGYGIDKQF
jgi:phage terminase large subunit GpA-like protein